MLAQWVTGICFVSLNVTGSNPSLKNVYFGACLFVCFFKCSCGFFFNIYLFGCAGSFSCGRWAPLLWNAKTLSCGMHVGSSSLTRDLTQAPCIRIAES